MNIAVYSGSFNPLHIGHLAIMESLCADPSIDKVYLVVSPKNPLKENISGSSATKRFQAACEAVTRRNLEKVEVNDIELSMPEPHYTINTLDLLKAQQPGDVFRLIMGADQLDDIHRWKDFDRILTEYGVLVYPRKGFELHKIIEKLQKENNHFQIGIIDAPTVDISSTIIRESIADGKDISEFLM